MMSNDQSSGSRGKAIATPPLAINCPRCDSPNTKFCYYNNYCLSQPRHFCKACKRYWTKGGALRNVPVGGSCRKTKKTNKSFSKDSKDCSSASSYSDVGRFKFFNGQDSQLVGGLTELPNFNNTMNTPTIGGQLVSSFTDIPIVPVSSSTIPNFGLNPGSETNMSQFMTLNNFPLSYSSPPFILKPDYAEDNTRSFNEVLVPDMVPTTGNLASSMESFSLIDQDLHWKLQQESMSMMLNEGSNNIYQLQNGMINATNHLESPTQSLKPNPILFHNLEISSKPSNVSRKEINGNVNVATTNLPTQWHFGDSSYTPVVNEIPSINEDGNGIQEWFNFDQYTSLP